MRLVVLLASLVAATAHAQPAVEAPLGRALAGIVQADGRVDYRSLARRASALDAALEAVAAMSPRALRSDAQKTAFLLNAYNARVLRLVLDHPQARHLERDNLFEPFFETPFRVAGQMLTLNEVEHGLLRRQSRVDGRAVPAGARALQPARVDFRIHAALNCAAVACPPLRARPFAATTLSSDLESAFRAMVDSDRHVGLRDGRLALSSLFDWFAADFEQGGARVGDRILGAMTPARAATYRSRLAGRSAAALRRDRTVAFVYDWTVNRAR